MATSMLEYAQQYAQLDYRQNDCSSPAAVAGSAPLPWGVAALLMAALSGGLWLGIVKLLAALL